MAEVEARPMASYLKQVRDELESNQEARDLVSKAFPASGSKEELVRILSTARPGRDYPVPKPGTEDLFEAAVDRVLAELEKQRGLPPALYIVDRDTGDVVMPLPAGGVYQPPDYIGEDGKTHKARPVVHPGITSSLAVARAEEFRKGKALAGVKDDLVAKKAYEHLEDPRQIAAGAADRLRSMGVEVSDLPAGGEPEDVVEFGREHVNGVFQSPNLSFHRSAMFADLLANKLMRLCGPGGGVLLGELSRRDNGKQCWYKIGVTVRRPKQLQ